MEYLVKARGIGAPAESLSYEELAELQREADAGNPVAGIRLARLPEAEQRLAVSLTKVFGGKVNKVKKPRAVTKARKPHAAPQDGRDPVLAAWLESSNPAHREMARAALERHG